MNNASRGNIVVAFACLTLAMAFVAWALQSSRDAMADYEVALRGYALLMLPAALLAGIGCAFATRSGHTDLASRLAIASGLGYLAVLKVAGLALAPLLAIAVAGIAALRTRPPASLSPVLLLVHLAGTLGGFHVALVLERYLAAVAPLAAMVRRLASG